MKLMKLGTQGLLMSSMVAKFLHPHCEVRQDGLFVIYILQD